MFFEILLFIGSLVYIFAMYPTVKGFNKELLPTLPTLKRLAQFPYNVVAVPIELLLAWAIYWPLRRFRTEMRERRIARDETLRREQEEEQQRLLTLRNAWLAEHVVTLYYNTVNGITAVMTPQDYTVLVRETEKARRNGLWSSDRLLMPSKEVAIFVHKTGLDLLVRSLKVKKERPINPWDVRVNWISDLDDLTERYNLELTQKEDIFVPYVNESLVPFCDQPYISDRSPDSLVFCQVPKSVFGK